MLGAAPGNTSGPEGGRTGVKCVKMGPGEVFSKHLLAVLG